MALIPINYVSIPAESTAEGLIYALLSEENVYVEVDESYGENEVELSMILPKGMDKIAERFLRHHLEKMGWKLQ